MKITFICVHLLKSVLRLIIAVATFSFENDLRETLSTEMDQPPFQPCSYKSTAVSCNLYSSLDTVLQFIMAISPIQLCEWNERSWNGNPTPFYSRDHTQLQVRLLIDFLRWHKSLVMHLIYIYVCTIEEKKRGGGHMKFSPSAYSFIRGPSEYHISSL